MATGNPEKNSFFVILLGVIFDTKKKKILIGRRENDPYIHELTWVFPGGRAEKTDAELEETLKIKIKEETGMNVENLGVIFAKTYPENRNFLSVYYLCEAVSGKEKPAGDLKELKWVKPEELEKYFTTSFHPTMKEYIMNLK